MVDAGPSLTINTFAELAEHEEEILARIRQRRNGGNLFMAHPFMLLADIGVHVGDQLRAELLRQDRYLRSLSKTPYRAIRNSRERPKVRYHVRGLFRETSS